MDQRTHESPMDFDWTNGKGPIDQDSPFITAFPQNQFNQNTSDHNGGIHQKRSRSVFESSARPQSSFPSLRPAANQRTLFSNCPPSPGKPLPSVPPPRIDFCTPRKPFDDFFSSGGETPNTTDNGADSEATPDMGWRSSKPATVRSQSPVKEAKKPGSPKKKRESLFGKLFNSQSRPVYSTKAENRVVKMRKRNTNKALTRSKNSQNYDSDSDGRGGIRKSSRRDDDGKDSSKSAQEETTIAAFLRLVEGHPNAPRILVQYLQLLGNALMFLFGLYMVYCCWSAIMANVDKDVEEKTAEAMLEIHQCKSDYIDAHCDEGSRITRDLCEKLHRCMLRNPTRVARAQIGASTFAKILNDFVEPISFKAMAFYLVGFAIFAFSFNAALSYIRHSVTLPQHYSQQHQQHQHPPPPTPQRHPSLGPPLYDAAAAMSFANHQYYAGVLEPGPSAAAATGAERQIEFR